MQDLSRTLWIALVAVLGSSLVAVLDADAGDRANRNAQRATRIAQAIQGKTFSLADAVRAAEKKTGGKALEAELELENGRVVIEVTILKMGTPNQLLEVEVDGATNRILEIEEDDDVDDVDDDDDGDDGDDDDGDDDGDDDDD